MEGAAGNTLRPEYVIKDSDSERLSNIVQVSVGDNHTCAVSKSDAVFCWGSNESGKVGMSGSVITLFKAFNLFRITATQVSAGNHHTCALKVDSTVICWGSGSEGQLGLGSGNTNSTTTIPNLNNVVQISTKGDYTCALNTDSKVLCWGDNEYGRAGRPLSQFNYLDTSSCSR